MNAWTLSNPGPPESSSGTFSTSSGCLSPVGQEIRNILTLSGTATSDDAYGSNAPNLGSEECKLDKWCVWKHITDDVVTLFHNSASGQCGADGSLVLAPEEIGRSGNEGLQRIAQQTQVWYDKYKEHGISIADLIQFNANVATGLVTLIGAHTASKERFVDTERANASQDTTPGIWDLKFYQQTFEGAPAEVFTFQSDNALSKDARSKHTFEVFAQSSQDIWNQAYAQEYVRLSLLSVYNINTLTDCTKSLPARNL
ncbi:peroxidase manganese-dependent 1 [Colletotrichum graminicola M1.001]|uniref:Peroxidase manganese-dependent 1 n=1 Tax=Colletotrichum graminicola (strain M1.001 / M2 / FGSC 10212) TaxID=645133 RepID=E3QPU5_COLGM|nr:peroxidase manganese-dependent 1 [Colletotrichum graminicola M1.001]EFQ32872.1 peroxidase manganese-dependent 1 [Colletotrichum graminicola M1.001]